jgi:ankyrin repeat protein
MEVQEEQQPAAADSTSTSSSSTFKLHLAARSGLVAEVAAMLAAGASTEVYDEQGATPLLWAAQQGRHEVRCMQDALPSRLYWWV